MQESQKLIETGMTEVTNKNNRHSSPQREMSHPAYVMSATLDDEQISVTDLQSLKHRGTMEIAMWLV